MSETYKQFSAEKLASKSFPPHLQQPFGPRPQVFTSRRGAGRLPKDLGEYRLILVPLEEPLPEGLEEVLQGEAPPESLIDQERPDPSQANFPGELLEGHIKYPDPVMEKTGVTWKVQYKGVCVSIKNSSGIPFLLHLLTHPYQDFHVLSLYALCKGQTQTPTQGSLGVVVDTQGIAAFRKRLLVLEEQKAQAEEWCDLGRLEKIEEEMEALNKEIRSALGMGGRLRQMGSDSERARKTISKAISRVIHPLQEAHPGLSRHLLRSIRMGSTMAYIPGKTVHWRVSR